MSCRYISISASENVQRTNLVNNYVSHHARRESWHNIFIISLRCPTNNSRPIEVEMSFKRRHGLHGLGECEGENRRLISSSMHCAPQAHQPGRRSKASSPFPLGVVKQLRTWLLTPDTPRLPTTSPTCAARFHVFHLLIDCFTDANISRMVISV